ncbi:hypothetical protein LTR94_035802, partial [Friedmanniomyces endolithicus]
REAAMRAGRCGFQEAREHPSFAAGRATTAQAVGDGGADRAFAGTVFAGRRIGHDPSATGFEDPAQRPIAAIAPSADRKVC